MSQGNSLTRRQRRGHSIQQLPLAPFPRCHFNYNSPTENKLHLEFDSPVQPSTNPADYDDWFFVYSPDIRVISAALIYPLIIEIVFSDDFGPDNSIQAANLHQPLRTAQGAAMGAFAFTTFNPGVYWPLPYPF